jgi:hypothetical protein
MIPYRIKFILDDKTKDEFLFDSNEKPFKGELHTIQDVNGKLWEAKITEVSKFVIRSQSSEATVEYRCKVEKHEPTATVIGFGKRS